MPQILNQAAELAKAESSLTVTQTPLVVPGPLTLSLLQRGCNRQRIAASQSLVGEARQPVDVRLGQQVVDHEFQQVSCGQPRRGPTAGGLKVPQTGSQGWVVRYRHASHRRRNRLGLLGTE